jgi:phosphoglycerate kinase
MEKNENQQPLKLLQNAPMKGKVFLVRVDHNVVKKGIIKDPYRIDATLGTLYAIAEKGGRPILLTHVGRPRDKKTGRIICRKEESVKPVVEYLERKLPIKIHCQDFPAHPERGIVKIDDSIKTSIDRLKRGDIGMIYLPNSRWFEGEQAKGAERDEFAASLASIAEIYINDAFGSWRAHASTYDIAQKLPSFAGALLQKEIKNLHQVLEPQRPFLAIIAGAKYDTKIGPLKSLYGKVDHLILGGLMYNTYIAAKNDLRIKGVSEEDKKLALELVELDRDGEKIVEMSHLVESDVIDGRKEGSYRSIEARQLYEKKESSYLVDIDPLSLARGQVKDIIQGAGTIFVNAVMGLMPYFPEGSEALYRAVASNRSAMKLFGGGDTLQELKALCPGLYLEGLDSGDTYYFTGGGSVLAALEQGSPYAMKPIEVLIDRD